MLPKLPSTFLKILFYGLLAAVPIGIRHYQYGFFIYATDILLVLFLIFFFLELRGVFWQKPKFLISFLAFSGLSIFFALSYQIAVYNFLHLILLVGASLAGAKLMRTGIVNMNSVAKVFGLSAVVQSFIGFLQFWKQGSIGLEFFGEPVISQSLNGVAKIVVEGAKLIRVYGTFPHPNILAGFLIIGLVSLFYLWLNRPSERKIWSSWSNLFSDLAIGLGIFSVIGGLFFSFSRSAWLVAVVVSFALIFYGLVSKVNFRQSIRLLILLLAICLTLFTGFSEYIFSRAKLIPNEPAVTLRTTYNKISLEIIKRHPMGVGIGNQIAFTRESDLYERFGLTENWQQQPIHNLYLLMAAEIGVAGALAFLFFIYKIFSKNIATLMLLALLLLGLTDHYLWTSQAGQLMLWLTLGLVIGIANAEGE